MIPLRALIQEVIIPPVILKLGMILTPPEAYLSAYSVDPKLGVKRVLPVSSGLRPGMLLNQTALHTKQCLFPNHQQYWDLEIMWVPWRVSFYSLTAMADLAHWLVCGDLFMDNQRSKSKGSPPQAGGASRYCKVRREMFQSFKILISTASQSKSNPWWTPRILVILYR